MADELGGSMPPTVRFDDVEPGAFRDAEGSWSISDSEYQRLRSRAAVCTSLHIEATPVASLLANGREAGAYVWGFWNRHLRMLPETWAGTIELLALVTRDHLPAVLTTMVQAGVNAAIHYDNGEYVTIRFFVEVAPAP